MNARIRLAANPAVGSHRLGPSLDPATDLPAWPLAAIYLGFPVWWLLGIVDFIYIPFAIIMIHFMARRRVSRTPKGFGIWLLFIVWAACSIIGLTQAIQIVSFGYRMANLLACTVIFLYTFNATRSLHDRYVSGVLTVWWLIVVAGGYLAMLLPTAAFRTPASYLVPGSLLNNDWVYRMVVRPLNQYNPDSYFQLAPRPSAPFIYSNQWGSIYSLLLPFVVAYLLQIPRTKRFWLLLLAIPVSFIPALETTNRGMLIGIALAATYAALRLGLRGDARGPIAIMTAALVGLALFQVLPIGEQLQARSEATSIEDRGWLYLQSLDAVRRSPLFGYGRTLTVDGAVDPVGTQGEFWIVLVSHGIGGVILFLGWFLTTFLRSFSWRTHVGLAANTVLLVGITEFFFYGSVPHGLPLLMITAALALRDSNTTADSAPASGDHSSSTLTKAGVSPK